MEVELHERWLAKPQGRDELLAKYYRAMMKMEDLCSGPDRKIEELELELEAGENLRWSEPRKKPVLKVVWGEKWDFAWRSTVQTSPKEVFEISQ